MSITNQVSYLGERILIYYDKSQDSFVKLRGKEADDYNNKYGQYFSYDTPEQHQTQ